MATQLQLKYYDTSLSDCRGNVTTLVRLQKKVKNGVAMARKTNVPKKYTAGLGSSTAAARKKEIRARAASKTPNYSPLPGDKTASGKQRKTKQSKHTTAYKRKYGG